MDVDGALLDEDMIAPDPVERRARVCTRSGFFMRKCSSLNSVGPTLSSAPLVADAVVAASSTSSPTWTWSLTIGRAAAQHGADAASSS